MGVSGGGVGVTSPLPHAAAPNAKIAAAPARAIRQFGRVIDLNKRLSPCPVGASIAGMARVKRSAVDGSTGPTCLVARFELHKTFPYLIRNYVELVRDCVGCEHRRLRLGMLVVGSHSDTT
jgi:hypothetical protein